MKKMIKNLMLVAVAAMAFVACSQDVNDINILPKQTALNFTARFVDDTRAYFGEKGEEGYPVYWAGGEAVAFVAPAADYDGTYTTYAEAVKADDQGIEATFDVVFDNPIKAGTVYAYLGEGWNQFSNEADVNDIQTPTATSVDPNCIMASTSFEYDGETMEVSGDFAHGVGYGKMTINGFEGKTISSVQLNFVGTNYCNYTLNVADIEEHTFWFASEENEVSNFTISVVVDGVSYSKEVEIDSDKHLYFKKGLVSKFSVSGLVKDPIQLEMPIVTTSFANGKVTASWSPIENAESYTVKVDGTVVEENYKETSYSFDASYSTYYSISVIANAAEGSADYVDSDEAFTSITTPLDINMVTDYTVTLTNYTIDLESSYGDKLFKFTSDDATKWINLPVNPNLNDVLPAGTYTGVYDYWSYSSDANLEFNYYDTQFNYAAMYVNEWATLKSAVEVVRESDDVWSITIIVTTDDNCTIKYVYSEEPMDPNAFDYTYDTLSWNSTYSRFELTGGDNGMTQFYLNANDRPGNNSIKANTYTYAGNTVSNPNAGTFSLRYLLGSGSGTSHFVRDASMSVTIEDGQYKIVITILDAGNANVVGKTFGYKGLPTDWPTPGGSEGGDEPEEPENPGDSIDLTGYTKCNLDSFTAGDAAFVAKFTLSDARYGDQYTFSIADLTGINVSQNVVKAGEYTFVESFNSCEMEASDFYYLGTKYNVTGTVTVYNQDGTYTIKVDAKAGISSLKFYYQGTL